MYSAVIIAYHIHACNCPSVRSMYCQENTIGKCLTAVALCLLAYAHVHTCTERERITITNIASTMAAMVSSQPLLPALDLTSLRIASCGGSPQPPSIVRCATYDWASLFRYATYDRVVCHI